MSAKLVIEGLNPIRNTVLALDAYAASRDSERSPSRTQRRIDDLKAALEQKQEIVDAQRDALAKLEQRYAAADEAHAEALAELAETTGQLRETTSRLTAAEVRAEAAEAKVEELEAQSHEAIDVSAAYLGACNVDRSCLVYDTRTGTDHRQCSLPRGHPGDHWASGALPTSTWPRA